MAFELYFLKRELFCKILREKNLDSGCQKSKINNIVFKMKVSLMDLLHITVHPYLILQPCYMLHCSKCKQSQ